MAKPWSTSNELIEDIKRKINLPVTQNTFTETDILRFLNQELMASQIPSMMEFHQEYLVATKSVPLVPNKSSYSIPDRAIGMKLRDLYYVDSSGNKFEVTRISSDDRAWFGNPQTNNLVCKYYLEGNNVVLVPEVGTTTGSLLFVYFLRPNQLVVDDRAATCESFSKTIVVSTLPTAGDTFDLDDESFIAGTTYVIGGTTAITASNLATAISTNGICSASVNSSTITLTYSNRGLDVTTSNSTAFDISSNIIINCDSIPTNIIDGTIVDFLQTKPGHKIYSYDLTLPTGTISGNTFILDDTDVPEDFSVNDYICEQNECIIPGIPPELHNLLTERACARILASIGDLNGMQATNVSIQQMVSSQVPLLDNRAEAHPTKVVQKHSLLRNGKYYPRNGY